MVVGPRSTEPGKSGAIKVVACCEQGMSVSNSREEDGKPCRSTIVGAVLWAVRDRSPDTINRDAVIGRCRGRRRLAKQPA